MFNNADTTADNTFKSLLALRQVIPKYFPGSRGKGVVFL